MPKLLSPGLRQERNQQAAQGLLWCNHCRQYHPTAEFYKCNDDTQATNYGHRYYCKTCENGPRRNKARIRRYYKEKNSDLKLQAVDFAGGACQRCGFSEFYSALEFHHVYPSKKKYVPNQRLYSRGVDGAWDELDKCCLLCSNCHNAYEGGEWRAEFIKRPGELGYTVGRSLPLDDKSYEEKPEIEGKTPLPVEYKQQDDYQLRLVERQVPFYLG